MLEAPEVSFNGDPKEGMDGFSELGAHVQSMGIPRLHPDDPSLLVLDW